MFHANYLKKADELKASIDVSEEVVQQFEEFWQRYRDKPFEGRNTLLRNICPQVYGLSTVKLAGLCLLH
jgi:DNA helicase MCM9